MAPPVRHLALHGSLRLIFVGFPAVWIGLLVRKVAETLETGLTVVPVQSSRGTVSKGLTDGAPVYITHEALVHILKVHIYTDVDLQGDIKHK